MSQSQDKINSHAGGSDDTIVVNQNRTLLRYLYLGLLANLAMALGKAIRGHLLHSETLIADGLHSFSDVIKDLVSLGFA